MKRFAQIEGNRAHWIFESEERPDFAPNIVLVEITNVNPAPQEGWSYDAKTGVFSNLPVLEPVTPVVRTVEEILSSMESQINEDSLVTMDILATIFEQIIVQGGK